MSIWNKLMALASTVAVSAYAMVTLGDQEMGQVNARDGITLTPPAPAIQLNVATFSYQPAEQHTTYVFSTQPVIEALFDRHFELLPNVPDSLPLDLSSLYKGGDVMAVTLSNNPLNTSQTLSVSVEQLTIGNGKNSLGAMQLNSVGLQGSRSYTWQH